MKKTWKLPSLVLCLPLLVLGACQEKIAPELSDPGSAAAAGGAGGGAADETSQTFSLTLENAPSGTAPELLGYTLHKANEVATSTCEITDIDDVPTALDSTRDISCFLEAEEFALHYNGFTVKANTDAEVCDYITATPYTFYKYMPGVSARADGTARQMVYFECTSTALATFGAVNMTATFGNNTSAFTTLNQMCGKYFNVDDDTITNPEFVTFGLLHLTATSEPVTADEITDMCSFDYSDDDGPNCDEGQIRVHKVNVGQLDPDPNVVGDEIQTIASGGETTTKCGGKVLACVGGPGPDYMTPTTFLKGISGKIVPLESQAGSISMAVQSSHLKRNYSIHASNFLRQCSGLPNFDTAANFNTLLTGYDPDVMEEYAALGTNLPGTQEKDEEFGQLDVIILADDPFRAGIDAATVAGNPKLLPWSHSQIGTNPNYTFLCLDKAYDVKARIRLSVREWNRNFSPTTQELRYISDIFSINAKMDAGGTQTNPNQSFNDYDDWDDLFTFSNSATNSCALSGSDPLVALPRTSAAFPIYDDIADD